MAVPQNSSRLLTSGLALLGGCWMLGWAVSEWLSDAQLANALWPADINRAVVELLGGSVVDDSVAAQHAEVSSLAVTLRLTLLTLAALAWARLRRADAVVVTTATRRTLCLWLSCCGWWPLFMLSDLLPEDGLQWWLASVLPLWLMATAAGTAWIWWQAACDRSDRLAELQRGSRLRWVLVAFVVTWIAVSFWMNERLYAGLLIPHGDSAMYEEHLWNVWHGKGFRSYLDQGLFLGEHVQVIHLLLLPLHMLWPSHLLLELAESVALASCAIPVYCIAKRRGGDEQAAVLLGLAWLLFFPMHYLDIAIDQKTFRPIALALPFLFWMIDCAERGRIGWATLWLLVALSAKEDVALVTFPLGCVFVLRSRRLNSSAAKLRDVRLQTVEPAPQAGFWWGIGAAGFSLAYLLLAVLVVIPAFRSGEVVHYSRYFGDLGGSPAELAKTAVTEPARVLARAFSFRTLLYIVVFVAPLGFVPFRRPLLLSAGVLTFGMLSLLQLGDEAGGFPPVPYHHFHAPLLPVLFWATCAAASGGSFVFRSPFARRAGRGDDPARVTQSSIADPLRSRSVARLVFLCCLFTGFTGSLTPAGATFWSAESTYGWRFLYTPGERAAMVPRVLEQIPMNARVASTDYIHTRLTHRERSYDYSGYPRAVSNYEDRVPADTDYIVIDTGHRYSTIKRPDQMRELLREPEKWEVLPDRTNGWFIVLKRSADGR